MGSATLQNEFWNKQPKDWSELSEPNHQPLLSAMLEATQVDKNTVLLDVGFGGGASSVMASERGAEVYGIDASSASVEIASQRLPDATFVEGDIESMSYPDGQFDVVFAANVLQYAENRQIAAAELARVCSRTGKVSLAYLDRQIGLHTEQYSKR